MQYLHTSRMSKSPNSNPRSQSLLMKLGANKLSFFLPLAPERFSLKIDNSTRTFSDVPTFSMCIDEVRIPAHPPIPMTSKLSRNLPSDLDLSPQRTCALIETDASEFEEIIELLRQFFPRTKVLESNHRQYNEQVSTPTFKGKVKDYLQRRYLEEIEKHPNLSPTRTYTIVDIDESSNETTRGAEKRTSTSSNPYSTTSDPGPLQSPWFNTPTSTFTFRFPHPQDTASINAQSNITQLSRLTKMLCDEPSVFTPISPRFKPDRAEFSCQICGQEFDSHQLSLIHYRTHLENACHSRTTDETRSYSCEICSKRFSRSDMLNRHVRLHSGIRPYRCTICNTQFSRSDHLSTHLRTHTGEKPYACSHCSYAACRRDMITRHLKIHRKQRSERKNATSTFHSTND